MSYLTRSLFLLLIVSTVSTTTFGQKKKSTPASSSANDESLIKSIIEKETQAFFEIDQNEWASYWAPVSYAFWSFADTTDVNSFSGWENIYNGFDNYFKTSKASTAKIKRDWLHIKIHGDMAYIRFTQLVDDDSQRPPQAEVRVMEKINGVWKIVCVSVIAMQKDNQPVR